MAIAFLLEFPGVTRKQYDRVIARCNLGGKMPAGGIYHVAGPTEDGWRIVDVWESQEAFDRFHQEALGEALQAEGVPEPKVSVWQVHSTLTD